VAWLLGAMPETVKLASEASPPYMGPETTGTRRTMMNPILWLILTVLDVYFWIILATVIMSWLVAFNVINGTNPYVRQVGYALRALTEPLLRPIRRVLPDLGGIDISPIVLLIGLQFVRYLVVYGAVQMM